MCSTMKRYSSKSLTSHVNTIDKEEADANTAISDLIANITILTARKDPLIRSIRSPNLLIRGLKELQSMVEMIDIKYSIVNQIKFLITNHARKTTGSLSIGIPRKGGEITDSTSSTLSTSPTGTTMSNSSPESGFEGHMLHSVISGNPGTGKTTVGMILAKIWMSLGFVNKKESSNEKSDTSSNQTSASVSLANNIVNTVNDSYRRRINELEEIQRNDRRKLDRLKELLTKYHTTSGKIRRRVIKLKPSTTVRPNSFPDQEKEWDQLLGYTRDMRFGFDKILREINLKDPVTISGSSGTSGTSAPNSSPAPIEVDPYENVDPKFVVAAREDLIAEYLGQTAPKTKKVLESALGGVLFIDEAYSICNMDGGSKDKYGEECLSTINEFMSLHPDEIIIIFAGYKDKLMSSIFKAQPGLQRRCTWFFEIKDYTHRGLAKIFSRQLAKNSWSLSPDIDIEKIISDNKDIIQYGGGGTEKLSFFVKMEYANAKFLETVQSTPENPVIHDSKITKPMIDAALIQMRNQLNDKMVIDNPPFGMYS